MPSPGYRMTLKHSTEKLTGVPETLLIPLYARAIETQRGGICHDPLAVEIMQQLDYDFSKFADGHATALAIAIRTAILDEFTRAYIARYPDAVIVNIAAGLDARFFRMDNGQIRWYELDLPESIDMRRRFFEESDRYTSIARSALDFTWLDEIERRPHTLFIIEGLLMYFDEGEVQGLIRTLAENFPGAEMLLEVLGRSQSQRTGRSDMVSKTGAQFKWGIRITADIADWHPRLHYVTDVSLYERHEDRWLALDIAWTAPLQALRNTVNRIVHLRVNTL